MWVWVYEEDLRPFYYLQNKFGCFWHPKLEKHQSLRAATLDKYTTSICNIHVYTSIHIPQTMVIWTSLSHFTRINLALTKTNSPKYPLWCHFLLTKTSGSFYLHWVARAFENQWFIEFGLCTDPALHSFNDSRGNFHSKNWWFCKRVFIRHPKFLKYAFKEKIICISELNHENNEQNLGSRYIMRVVTFNHLVLKTVSNIQFQIGSINGQPLTKWIKRKTLLHSTALVGYGIPIVG